MYGNMKHCSMRRGLEGGAMVGDIRKSYRRHSVSHTEI